MEKLPGSVEACANTVRTCLLRDVFFSLHLQKKKNTGLEEIFIMFAFSACKQGSALHMCLQIKH